MNLTLECLAVRPTYVELTTRGGEGLHLDINDTSYFKEGAWYNVCILSINPPKEVT